MFLMGSDKKKDKQAYDDEKPQHTLMLPDFRIGKYPVTNRQYATFVAATGRPAPSIGVGTSRRPSCATIRWSMSVARCGRLLRLAEPGAGQRDASADRGGMGAGRERYRRTDLPVGQLTSTGDAVTWRDTGIGGTSPVGIFPTGDAECGASDMAGNVWEWTSSLWDKRYRDVRCHGWPGGPEGDRRAHVPRRVVQD